MKKILNIVLILFMFLGTGVTQAVHSATRTGWGNQFLTSSKLVDENGDSVSSSGIYDSLQASYTFNIPAGTPILAGDTMEVTVPDVLKLPYPITFDIKDTAGNVIGTAVTDSTTGVITITFSDYAQESASGGIKGSFNVWVSWDRDSVNVGGEVPVFGDTVHITGDDSSGTLLSKTGWLDPNDPTKVIWRVVVNSTQEELNNAVYTDFIGDNQTLISGSVEAYNVIWTNYPTDFNVESYYPSSAIVEDSSTQFHVNLGNINQTVIIDYETQTTDNGNSTQYHNSGTLSGSNINNQNVNSVTEASGGGGEGETTVSVSGTKTWVDSDDVSGLRPDSITVNLLADDVKVDSKEVTATDNWSYSFNNLNKYDAKGVEIKYTVSEDKVPNYTATIDGANITNTLSGVTSLSGTKTWVDNDDVSGLRPDSITVNLLANGVKVDSKEVTATDNWSYSFNNLNKYDAKGVEIKYTVSEDRVPNYTATIDGANIINTLTTSSLTKPSEFPRPNKPEKQSTLTVEKTPVSTSSKEYRQSTLPDTGDNNAFATMIASGGLFMILMSLGLWRWKKKL